MNADPPAPEYKEAADKYRRRPMPASRARRCHGSQCAVCARLQPRRRAAGFPDRLSRLRLTA